MTPITPIGGRDLIREEDYQSLLALPEYTRGNLYVKQRAVEYEGIPANLVIARSHKKTIAKGFIEHGPENDLELQLNLKVYSFRDKKHLVRLHPFLRLPSPFREHLDMTDLKDYLAITQEYLSPLFICDGEKGLWVKKADKDLLWIPATRVRIAGEDDTSIMALGLEERIKPQAASDGYQGLRVLPHPHQG